MKYAFVDYRITDEEKANLHDLGCSIVTCPPSPLLYSAICGHPDMLMHFIAKNKVIVHKDMDINFINFIKNLNFQVCYTSNSLRNSYPFDILLNALNLENYFVHNINFTDKNLLCSISNKKLIQVKQGYTKCSTAIVNDKALITSDKSIYKALDSEDIDILLLPPGDINLPGLDYGFIGGTCGLLDKKLVFYGNLKNYKYEDLVLKFLDKHEVEPYYLSSGPLVDRGSIFFAQNHTLI
ncbi:DUF6873 family GME fold protein [Clostridium sp.]|uniref:DUF6873 family GME fold protein n=1 Tax=Clostridium sp. TaxID=1506 RepID=UPI002FC90E5F